MVFQSQEPRLLLPYAFVILPGDFHFIVQHDCSSSSYQPTFNQQKSGRIKEGHGPASKDTSWKLHLLTHHWPEFSHRAILSCKRGWEIFISGSWIFRQLCIEVNIKSIVTKDKRENGYWVTASSLCHMLSHLEICARFSFCLGQPTSCRHTLLAWPIFICPLTFTHLMTIFIHDRTQYNLTIPGQGGLTTNICCLKDILGNGLIFFRLPGPPQIWRKIWR